VGLDHLGALTGAARPHRDRLRHAGALRWVRWLRDPAVPRARDRAGRGVRGL